MTTTHRRHAPLLGTTVEVKITATSGTAAEQAQSMWLAEATRLSAIFNVFDPDSALSRFCSDMDNDPPAELRTVLRLAAEWTKRSRGCLNPAIGSVMSLWSEAEQLGRAPSDESIAEALATTNPLPYEVDEAEVRRTGDCTHLNLNAIAKGWIVDRAVACLADVTEIAELTVNAGGDVLHRGPRTLRVGIENPTRPYDNEPPLWIVEIADQAIATSGSARRGYTVGKRRHSHIIDPRSGRPADGISSASVVAEDLATADVLATILTVSTPDEGLWLIEGLDQRVAAAVIDNAGDEHVNEAWSALAP